MFMEKAIRDSIYMKLLNDGVMTAKKDFRPQVKHPEVGVKNLFVVKALQSLKSRGYVNEQFAWRSYYWTLTNEGISFLREQLYLPATVVPNTLKKGESRTGPGRLPGARSAAGGEGAGAGAEPPRMAYRRGPTQAGVPGADGAAAEKEEAAGVSHGDMHFQGGIGRGKAL